MTQMMGSRSETTHSSTQAVATGVAGLDCVPHGGVTLNRLYLDLVEGTPGSGNTTLGSQFLLEGVRQGERVVYVMLSETTSELRAVAQSYGWSLEGNGALMSEVNGH